MSVYRLNRESSAVFHLETNEWPLEAAKRNMKNPFKKLYEQIELIEGVEPFEDKDGKMHLVKCHRVRDNPSAPPVPTMTERADYSFEKEKFVIRRLFEEGLIDRAHKYTKACFPGNEERLLEYIKEIENGGCYS